jgi:hypothetical protein
MSSQNGKQKSFKRYQLGVTQMADRSASGRQAALYELEQRKLIHAVGQPEKLSLTQTLLREHLIVILVDPDLKSAKEFGIIWNSNCPWAEGPSIAPYATIFDRFVEGYWKVTVVDDIYDEGSPGWVFTRV